MRFGERKGKREREREERERREREKVISAHKRTLELKKARGVEKVAHGTLGGGGRAVGETRELRSEHSTLHIGCNFRMAVWRVRESTYPSQLPQHLSPEGGHKRGHQGVRGATRG